MGVRKGVRRDRCFDVSALACSAALFLLGCGQAVNDADGPGGSARGGAGASGNGAAGASGNGAGATSGGAPASAGQGAGAAAGSGGFPSTKVPSVAGTWAMFVFEDPVAVELVQSADVLSGRGCCGGLGALNDFCCGPISGLIEGQRARFGFPLGDVAGQYSADVFVSEAGDRMAGAFKNLTGSSRTAWVRIPAGQEWLRNDDVVVRDAIGARVGAYEITLRGEGGDGLSSGNSYALRLLAGGIPAVSGDLGPFWAGELRWDEEAHVLVAGPVSVTDPSLPIALRLVFLVNLLTLVEATFASGASYHFSAAKVLE